VSHLSRHPTALFASFQRGYSLIEVVVAIAIALFLMGGALRIVQNTRTSSKIQGQLAQLQDSERMAMQLMTDVIQSTGYYPNPHIFTAAETLVSPSFAARGAPNIAAVPVPGALGDTITVRYAAGPLDKVNNCRGDQNTGAGAFETWENTFSVVQAASGPGGVPQFQLQCRLWSRSTGAFVTNPLVLGVQNLTIVYGINTAGAGTGSCADRYKASKDMQPVDWSNVCSVKVTLTFTNPMNPPGGAKPTIAFTRVIAVMNKV
jgi:type IV pilus assembly protein PilW